MLYSAAAGVYGLVEYFRARPVTPAYWGLIAFGNLLALAQGALGGWMALHGGQPTRGWLHMLYGAVAVLWIPAIQLLNRKRSGRDATLTCALVSSAEFVIALRAMATA